MIDINRPVSYDTDRQSTEDDQHERFVKQSSTCSFHFRGNLKRRITRTETYQDDGANESIARAERNRHDGFYQEG